MENILKPNSQLWELFTKKEEYKTSKEYEYRLTYSSSTHKNILEPEVSKFLIQNGFKVVYPEEYRFAVCLTHDIDQIFYPELKMAYNIERFSKKYKLDESLNGLLGRAYRRVNRLWNFKEIMKLEEKYEASSSFYFLALEKNDVDFRYTLEEIENDLKEIINNGHEIGLHGGLMAFDSLSKIKQEKEKLEGIIGKKIIGYRNHYLKFKIPSTWEYLKMAGFKYDTTFGYYDHVGFRNGICHPFKPYNLKTKETIDIMEIPLIIMDRTLDKYMKLSLKDRWKLIKKLIDIVARYHGVITILWHNSYMVDEMLAIYEKILKYCKTSDAWLTSGEQIWRWWKKNDFFVN